VALKGATSSPERVQILIRIRDTEERILEVLGAQREKMQRENDNMARALAILEQRTVLGPDNN